MSAVAIKKRNRLFKVLNRRTYPSRPCILALVILGMLLSGRSSLAAPLVTLRKAVVTPGNSVTLPVQVVSGVPNVAGLDLTLQPASARQGAPPLQLSFSPGDQAAGWQSFSDANQPLRYVVFNSTGIPGPAELMKLTVAVPDSTPLGTIYFLQAASAILSDQNGVEQKGSGIVMPGWVAAVLYGDLDFNGIVDARDANLLLRISIGLKTSSAAELAAGDVRPNPGMEGQSVGDGVIDLNDVSWILRRWIGLASAP